MSLVCVEPEPLFRARFASVGEKTWPVQKRPELRSVQVEGVLGCHCCETAPPEHHGDILDLALLCGIQAAARITGKRWCQRALTRSWKVAMETCISWLKRIGRRTVKECLTHRDSEELRGRIGYRKYRHES